MSSSSQNQPQDNSKNKDVKKKHRSHRHRMVREARNKQLPKNFFQDIIEAENAIIADSSKENCEKLIFLYKTAAEYYAHRDKDLEQIYVKEIQKLLVKPEVMQIYAHKNENKDNSNQVKQQINPTITKVKMLIAANRANPIDLRKKVKEIIEQYNNGCTNFNMINKKSDSEQKQQLCKNTKIKTFSNLILYEEDMKENINDNNSNNETNNDEQNNVNINNDLNNKNELDLLRGSAKIRKLQRKTSQIISFGSKDNICRSDKRRKTLQLYRTQLNLDSINLSNTNNNNNNDSDNNKNIKLMPKDSSTSLLSPQQQKAFIKNDMSEELMRFLRDYNKKLYFLFQKQIEESIRHLNNTLDKTYRDKINKHFEFQDSLGEYQLMLDEAVDETLAENVSELVKSLENEYKIDMENITNTENNKMQKITKHYAKKQLKNNIVIGNLNIETLGEIVNIFK